MRKKRKKSSKQVGKCLLEIRAMNQEAALVLLVFNPQN